MVPCHLWDEVSCKHAVADGGEVEQAFTNESAHIEKHVGCREEGPHLQ